MAETLKTKANTEFMNWWPLLNKEMEKQSWKQVGFKDANSCWEMGESPETAAKQLIVMWS